MTRFLSLTLFAGLVATVSLSAQEAASPEARLRETLRATTLQLRTAQNDLSTAQAARDALATEKTAVEAELAKLQKQLVADRLDNDKTIAGQKAVAAAQAAGVKHIVVTHALFPSLHASDADLRAMAKLGAWIELAWLMHSTPKIGPSLPPALARPMVPLARAVEVIRDIGARHIILSSDFGQATNPPPTEGLRDFLNALTDAGIPPADLDLMARRNPATILGLTP